MTLSGTTTPGQNGPGSDGNKGVPHMPASPSDCLEEYPGQSLGESYPSAEMSSGPGVRCHEWLSDFLSFGLFVFAPA